MDYMLILYVGREYLRAAARGRAPRESVAVILWERTERRKTRIGQTQCYLDDPEAISASLPSPVAPAVLSFALRASARVRACPKR